MIPIDRQFEDKNWPAGEFQAYTQQDNAYREKSEECMKRDLFIEHKLYD